MTEKPYRSIIKAFSWRFTATLTTVIVSYAITETVTVALSIGAIEFIVKLFIYYQHERLWDKITFGRKMQS